MTVLDSTEPSTASGRFIRAALVIFPLGTIVLGIASFGIWSWKKNRVEDRNLRHAAALRQEPNAAAWSRHLEILERVSQGEPADRLASTASYVESSLGAESMGYAPQRFITKLEDGLGVDGVLAELTGARRPREIVLVFLAYGESGRESAQEENTALASALSLAHWLTGEPVVRTVRFAFLPLAALDESERRDALTRLGEDMRRRDERITHLLDVSAGATDWTAEAAPAFDMAARGTVPLRQPLPAKAERLPDLAALRARLLELGAGG